MNVPEVAMEEMLNLIDEAWDHSKKEWKPGGTGLAVKKAFELGYHYGLLHAAEEYGS